MKCVFVFSIIMRTVALVAILAFVYAIVVFTNNMKFLWLLWLLIAVEFVPVYVHKGTIDKADD